MNCPACRHVLSRMTVDGVEVDVCKDGCGGLWFDNWELKKFDEPHEIGGAPLLDIPLNPAIHVDHSVRIRCPKCKENGVLLRHFHSVKRRVVVDECPDCAGVWLDAGELCAVRNEYKSEEERKAHVERVFQEEFAPQLQRMLEEHEEDLEKNQGKINSILNLFFWLCPSWWIPGKQMWGRF